MFYAHDKSSLRVGAQKSSRLNSGANQDKSTVRSTTALLHFVLAWIWFDPKVAKDHFVTTAALSCFCFPWSGLFTTTHLHTHWFVFLWRTQNQLFEWIWPSAMLASLLWLKQVILPLYNLLKTIVSKGLSPKRYESWDRLAWEGSICCQRCQSRHCSGTQGHIWELSLGNGKA